MVKVLIVDDNPADIALCKYCIQQTCSAPVEIAVAYDGTMGLATAAGPPVPDLILLDINMPKLDGLKMLEQLHIPGRRIPVIVLSNSTAKRDVEGAYILGASAYIKKPLNYDEFAEAIQSICKLWVRSLFEIKAASAQA